MKSILLPIVSVFALPLLGEASDFQSAVLPIFESKCFRCHGNGESKGGLSLDADKIEKHIRRNGAISPGSGDRSELVMRVTVAEGNKKMPRNGAPLSESEVEAIKAWIDAGAKLDAESPGDAPASTAMARPERVKEEWTNREGRSIMATLLRVDGDKAVLLLETGKSVNYPIENLSDESQAKIRAFSGGQ